jgi:hypothetical protein
MKTQRIPSARIGSPQMIIGTMVQNMTRAPGSCLAKRRENTIVRSRSRTDSLSRSYGRARTAEPGGSFSTQSATISSLYIQVEVRREVAGA